MILLGLTVFKFCQFLTISDMYFKYITISIPTVSAIYFQQSILQRVTALFADFLALQRDEELWDQSVAGKAWRCWDVFEDHSDEWHVGKPKTTWNVRFNSLWTSHNGAQNRARLSANRTVGTQSLKHVTWNILTVSLWLTVLELSQATRAPASFPWATQGSDGRNISGPWGCPVRLSATPSCILSFEVNTDPVIMWYHLFIYVHICSINLYI